MTIEKGKPTIYRQLTGQRLEDARRKWRHIKWLIIDEISMVSYEILRSDHVFKNLKTIINYLVVLIYYYLEILCNYHLLKEVGVSSNLYVFKVSRIYGNILVCVN